MADIATRSADNPQFARVIATARLRRLGGLAFDLAPTEAEAAALARLIDAQAVQEMRLEGVLRPAGAGWALEAALNATVVQTCVATLEPVAATIAVPVRRLFLPEAQAGLGPAGPVEVSPAEEEEPEPLGERIDLGLIAIEALVLALPSYPRHPDAPPLPTHAAGGPEDAPDADHPFAALAPLRDRLDRG